MKQLFLATIATAVMAGSAFAADMPLKAPPPILAYDWSGMYIGGVIGGAWQRTDTSVPSLGVLGTLVNAPVVTTTDGSGFIGGVEGGDRYQFGKLVVGWEADMTWGGVNGTNSTTFGPSFFPPLTFTRTITADTNWQGTATSTLGIAHDRWLIYGKAGVAWEHTNYTVNSNREPRRRASASTPPGSPASAAKTGSAGRWERASSGRSGTAGRSRPNTTTSTSATRPWPSTARCFPPSAAASGFHAASKTRPTSISSRPA